MKFQKKLWWEKIFKSTNDKIKKNEINQWHEATLLEKPFPKKCVDYKTYPRFCLIEALSPTTSA